MSLEATIARAISLHSITTLSSSNSSNNSNIINSSSINSGSSSCNYKKGDTVVSLKQQEQELQQEQYQQQQQQHQKKSEHSRVHEITTPSSVQARNQQEEKEQRLQNKTKRRAPKPPRSGKKESSTQQLSTRTTSSTATKPPSSCHLLVEQILYTVGELEHTLIEDHQSDFELRMELERQVEKVRDLRSSLEMEKKRNQRLVQLIRGVDSSSSTEDEDIINLRHNSGVGMGAACKGNTVGDAGMRHISNGCWQSRSSMDAFESISPLLMQQRYDELSTSYKQCRRQLVKKEKLLTRAKCEREELQGHYDHMLDEYRNVQKRFEELCCKYLRLQSKKNQEIQKLREALSYASDCVLSAQQVMEYNDSDANCCIEFRQNLQYFIKALRLCEWVQHCETQRNKR